MHLTIACPPRRQRFRPLALAFALACACGAIAQQPMKLDPAPRELILPPDGATVPMLRHLAWAVVEARVNGRGPFQFVVDTGASGVLLRADLVGELGLAEAGDGVRQVRVAGPGGKGLPASIHELESLHVGPLELRGLTALAAELPFPEDLAGVIGMAVFGEVLFTLDYPAGQFRFERGSLPEANQRDIFDIELGPRRSHPRLAIQLCGRETVFTLDTGMNGWFRWPHAIADACPFEAGPVAGPPARSVDREMETRLARLASDVQIGAFAFHKPHGAVGETTDPSPLIGGRALEHFALTIDAANSRLRLKREDSQPITPPAVRVLGFATRGTAEGHVVWGVMPGGPAAAAGVQAGDVALEINGRPVGEWQVGGRMEELQKQARVRVKLRRGDEAPREVEFAVQELLPAAKDGK